MKICGDWKVESYKKDTSKNSKIDNSRKTRETIRVSLLKEELFLIQSILQHQQYDKTCELFLDNSSFNINRARKSLLSGVKKALKIRLKSIELGGDNK